MTTEHQLFDAGDVTLACGRVFPSLQIAYTTYGTLNAARDNVIVFPTSFGAQHPDLEWLIGEGAPFDPARWFIVIPNLFGNGLSSSPSNSTPRLSLADYPLVSYHDAIHAQHRLVVEHLGVRRIALVYGWSMGGMQAYHWAALYPDLIDRVAVVCGSARCSPYNRVFLEGARAALTGDRAFQDNHFVAPPERGYRAMGRVYAGWALSHGFYRDELWREAGYASLEAFLVGAWDTNFARRDANDLLAQLATWQGGDISATPRFGGDLTRALAAVKSHVLLMPGETDEYFQVDDNARELPLLVNARSAELRPIPSLWGHRAGNPEKIPQDRVWLEAAIKGFLDLPV
ncbi:MAG: alpha/beta fold hydrolase [Janthinobacterium lividum]